MPVSLAGQLTPYGDPHGVLAETSGRQDRMAAREELRAIDHRLDTDLERPFSGRAASSGRSQELANARR
jgi:hypothetical protein